MVRKGHEVIHISRQFGELPARELINGVQHKRIRSYANPASGLLHKFRDLLYSRRAVREVPRDADVVITNTFFSPILISGKLKRKVMVSVERMPKGQLKLYTRAGLLRGNSTATVNAMLRELKPEFHHLVVMVPNALTFVTNHAQPVERKKVILFTGRIHPEKGLDLLIRAFSHMKTGHELRIVGPHSFAAGGGGDDYINSLKKLAGSANVTFPGPVFSDKLNLHYQESSIFVYPSLAEMGETFGLSPLEAMAWGSVPVVSDLACFTDFIRHGDNGLVFDHRAADAEDRLAASIQQLIDDDPLRSRLSENALAVNETHSTAAVAAQFLDAFEQIKRKNG